MTKSLEKRIYDIVFRNRACYMDPARVRDTAADIMKEIEADRIATKREDARKAIQSAIRSIDTARDALEAAHAAMRDHGSKNVLIDSFVDDEGKPFRIYKNVFANPAGPILTRPRGVPPGSRVLRIYDSNTGFGMVPADQIT